MPEWLHLAVSSSAARAAAAETVSRAAFVVLLSATVCLANKIMTRVSPTRTAFATMMKTFILTLWLLALT
jgi:hypothetical protein